MKKIYIIILFGLFVGILGCTIDNPKSPQVPLTPQQQVLENCRLVKAAAEQFAARNNQVFPADNTDMTAGGQSLIDFLPDGQLLENPYTGERTSPVNGGANSPGDVGYIGFRCDVEVTSYAITGVAEVEGNRFVTIRKKCSGEVVELTTESIWELDDLVLENCFIVQSAAEAYTAGNNGVYATDRTTPNLEGNTLIDLLPDGGFLVNPATGNPTEPSGSCTARNGANSYSQIEEWDNDLDQYVQTGYFIGGRGVNDRLVVTNLQRSLLDKERQVIENCLVIRQAVEAHAADNNGVYANGFATRTPAGMTVIDYLPEGRLLVNPFTGARTEPVVGMPAAQGSTGYLCIDRDRDGKMDGYQIDGLGGDPCTPAISLVYPPD